MNKLFFAVWLLTASTFSFAVVDMRNGNYSESWTDLELKGIVQDLRVVRTYNSRTTFDGMFGYGWCSDYETRIEAMPDGTLKLTECGAGQQVIYRSVPNSVGNNNTIATSQSARLYRANGKEFDTIVYASGQYVRSTSSNHQETFDQTGRRIKTHEANGNEMLYSYAEGRLNKVSSNDGREMTFGYGSNGKVESIRSSKTLSASYHYNGADLVSVTNGWGNTYQYQYKAHKLTRAEWPEQSFIELKYDTAQDWVTNYTDRNGCQEAYQYDDFPDDPQHHYGATLLKNGCSDNRTEGKFEFWQAQRADGANYLARIKSETVEIHADDSEKHWVARDVHYHETFGLPVALKVGIDDYSYTYYPNGLVKSKTSHYVTDTYQYAQDKLIHRVGITRDDAGKVTIRTQVHFAYDEKGNMVKARNSHGIKLKLGYNAKGQISSLQDNKHHVLSVQYDDKCLKPNVITLKGKGSVSVKYNEVCDIAAVTSPQTPGMAMHVAGLFNDLLDVVTPASMEIYE